MSQRHYSSTATQMSLTASMSSSSLTMTVNSVQGLPADVPFTLFVDPDKASEEIVTVTAVAGSILTVVRGEDGTSAQAHTTGSAVRHGVSARDLREPQQHMDAALGVHGLSVTDHVAGVTATQTFTNKSMSGVDNAFHDVPQSAITALPAALADLTDGTVALRSEVDSFVTSFTTNRDAAWVAHAPTLAGVTLGDGVLSARYRRIGKTVHYAGEIRLGSVSAITGNVTIALPLALGGVHNSVYSVLGCALLNGPSTAVYFAIPASATAFNIKSSTGVPAGPGAPWAWANGHRITWNIAYETSE